MTKPYLLIDGDEYLYQATVAVETEVQWDEQNHIIHSNVNEAWDAFNRHIVKTVEALGAQDYCLAFSGPNLFRRNIYSGYKNGRGRKPLCYARLLERCFKDKPSYQYEGLEADDLMGIWSTGKFKGSIIVSQDKDMLTIPGKLVRRIPDDGLPEVQIVSEDEANYYWLMQTLTGDITDGYSGVPGIGPKTAEKLLHEFFDGEQSFHVDEAWEAVVRTYEAKGLTYDDALMNARLARILRAEDWDTKKQEVKLWTP